MEAFFMNKYFYAIFSMSMVAHAATFCVSTEKQKEGEALLNAMGWGNDWDWNKVFKIVDEYSINPKEARLFTATEGYGYDAFNYTLMQKAERDNNLNAIKKLVEKYKLSVPTTLLYSDDAGIVKYAIQKGLAKKLTEEKIVDAVHIILSNQICNNFGILVKQGVFSSFSVKGLNSLINILTINKYALSQVEDCPAAEKDPLILFLNSANIPIDKLKKVVQQRNKTKLITQPGAQKQVSEPDGRVYFSNAEEYNQATQEIENYIKKMSK